MVVDEISVVVDDFKLVVKYCFDFFEFGAVLIALGCGGFLFSFGCWFHNDGICMGRGKGCRELF